jgi:hypothetical protein
MTSYDIPMDSSVGDVLYYFQEKCETALDAAVHDIFERAIDHLYQECEHVTLKKIINLLTKYKKLDEKEGNNIIYTTAIDEINKCICEIKSRK